VSGTDLPLELLGPTAIESSVEAFFAPSATLPELSCGGPVVGDSDYSGRISVEIP
jgi:hypothetical protein